MKLQPDDDVAPFEKTPNTKNGNGSVHAANKGKVKRRFSTERRTWKHRKR